MADNPPEANQKSEQDQSFDFKSAFADLAAKESERAGRKLTFMDQCQAFGALQNHTRPSIIVKAFGITRGAVSQIAGCLTNHRYPRVARHWSELGEYEFQKRYLTRELHERLARIKYNVDEVGDRRTRSKPNPLADKKSFRTIGAFPINDEFWRVTWLGWNNHPEKNGWYFTYCKSDGSIIEGQEKFRWYGSEAHVDDEPQPFRTSGYAYNAAFAFVGAPIPRP